MRTKFIAPTLALLLLAPLSCAPRKAPPLKIPSLEYSNRIKAQFAGQAQQRSAAGAAAAPAAARFANFTPARIATDDQARAQLRFVADAMVAQGAEAAEPAVQAEGEEANAPHYLEYRSTQANTRDYTGPLALGDPGVTASLWHESRGGSELFRDDRAWQPMDLITIVVSETSEGKKEADAEVKQDSEYSASIDNLLGAEKDIKTKNPNLDLSNLLKAATSNSFKSDGSTNRKDTLKARISAMVAEVLPSGILRVEGERIISVNSEEQVMVISGLVRTRDINSGNEIESAKIANLRIDYYGRGLVGDALHGGWLGRIIRVVWPF